MIASMMYRCVQCGAFNRVPHERPTGTATCGRCAKALDLTGQPQDVDGGALLRALNASPLPVVVDFWAPWCGPCRAAAPLVERFAHTQAGRMLVLKVNTEASPEAAQHFGIRGIPTFVTFLNGAELGRRSGVLPAPELERWARQLVTSGAAHASSSTH